jgi:hypothetical protein
LIFPPYLDCCVDFRLTLAEKQQIISLAHDL